MNEEILQGTTGDPLDEQEATAELEAQDLTPDEAAAALSFATNLQERFTEEEAMMAGVRGEEAPEGEEMPQEEVETEEVIEEPVEEEITEPKEIKEEPQKDLSKDFDEFKGEVKGIIETEIGNLTQTIKDALKD